MVLWVADLIWGFFTVYRKTSLSLFVPPDSAPPPSLCTPGIILFSIGELLFRRGKQNLILLFKSHETVTSILLGPSQFYT